MWARKVGPFPMIRIGSATRTHQKVKYREDCNNNASLTSYLAGFSSNFPVEVDRGIERDLWPSPFVPLSKELATEREKSEQGKESSSSVFTFAPVSVQDGRHTGQDDGDELPEATGLHARDEPHHPRAADPDAEPDARADGRGADRACAGTPPLARVLLHAGLGRHDFRVGTRFFTLHILAAFSSCQRKFFFLLRG